MATTHGPVPEHAPDHPVNVESGAAEAFKVTEVPVENATEQLAPQSTPDGDDVTRPDPDPMKKSDTLYDDGVRMNDAPTDLADVMDTTHDPVPEQAPDQPVKVESGAAVAYSATDVPVANGVEHVAPQSIPDGDDNTAPEPDPVRDTVKL